MIGHNLLRMGQPEPAIEVLDQANSICREHKVGGRFLSWVHNGYAWAYVQAAEAAIGEGGRPDLARASQACKEARKSARSYRLLEAEALRLQGTCDWLRGRTTNAERWWARSLELATEFGQPYELAMTYKEMGLRLAHPPYRDKARELLAEIGARADLPAPE